MLQGRRGRNQFGITDEDTAELRKQLNSTRAVTEPDTMSAEVECRKAFEAKCQFMRVEWSLEWDDAGFYSQLETDRAYTWFKFGFDQAKSTHVTPLAS